MLPAVRSRMGLFPRRRDLAELPELRPGTALVFKVGDRYQALLGGHHLNGTEPEVVDAVSVAVVNVRRDHLLRVAIDLPSANPADSFRVEVAFMCTVEDPVAVVREGLVDPAAHLAVYLRREIRTLGQRFNANDVDHLIQLRGQVSAHVAAVCQIRPLHLEGMTVVLADVDVHAPRGLVEFEQKKRDQTMAQELERRAKAFNREQAALYEEIRRRGAIAMEALAMQLGEVTAAEVASRAFDLEEHQRQRIAEALIVLVEHGHLDRVPLDAQRLITRLVQSVVGAGHASPADAAGELEEVSRREIGGREAATPGALPDRPQSVPLYVRAQMEPELIVEAVSTVSVTVACEPIRHVDRPTDTGEHIEANPNQTLLLELIPRANVEVVGRSRVEVAIPSPGEPKLVLFDVIATHLGLGEVWILVRQQQVPLATLVLKPRVVSQLTLKVRSQVFDQREVVPATGSTRPLHLLRIIEQRQGDAVVYRYDLEAPDLELLHAFASRPIYQPRDQYVRSLFHRIEDYWVGSARDVRAFQDQLRAFGGELLDELVPAELQRILWHHRDTLVHILVLSTEPFVPWELIHLKDPDSGRLPSETHFLGQMGLVRWQWGSWPPESLLLRSGRVRYIIPDYPDPRYRLPETGNERRFLEQQLGATAVKPHHHEVLELLRRPESFDLLHFAGHGVATGDDITDAQLLLEGRQEAGGYVTEPLRASLVAQNFKIESDTHPIVVLNACQVGRLGYQLTSIGGFAAAFVEGGAGAFISSLWSVGDAPARAFVQALYQALHEGDSMAIATIRAREQARRSGDATWLAYTVYAHPDAQLQH